MDFENLNTGCCRVRTARVSNIATIAVSELGGSGATIASRILFKFAIFIGSNSPKAAMRILTSES